MIEAWRDRIRIGPGLASSNPSIRHSQPEDHPAGLPEQVSPPQLEPVAHSHEAGPVGPKTGAHPNEKCSNYCIYLTGQIRQQHGHQPPGDRRRPRANRSPAIHQESSNEQDR